MPERKAQLRTAAAAAAAILDILTIIGTDTRKGFIMQGLQSVVGEYGLYDRGVTIVKEVGESIKVVQLRSVRKKGLEGEKTKKGEGRRPKEREPNYTKLEAATSRAKRMIKEYALCNDWDWFVTLTIDPEKFDRHDLKVYYKALGEFIHNYNRRCDEAYKVRFLLIPELHKDGAWHMHGLIKGIRPNDLVVPQFIPKRTKHGALKMVRNTKGYARWAQYTAKFGYISMERIRDKQKVSNYITKYISKGLASSVKEYGAHLYYCSKGLKTGTVIYRGTDAITVTSGWDYERPDGFCKVKWYDSLDSFASDFRIGFCEVPGVVVDDDGNILPDYAAAMIL